MTTTIHLAIDGTERTLTTETVVKQNMETGEAEHVLNADLDGCIYQGIGLTDEAALAALVTDMGWHFDSVELVVPDEDEPAAIDIAAPPFALSDFRPLDLPGVAGLLDFEDGPLVMA